MKKRNELYKGNKGDVTKIESFLKQKRLEIPEKFAKHISLNDAKQNDELDIDWKLFQDIIETAEKHFKTFSDQFELMPFDRYLVSQPKDTSIGGFYGVPAGGYYYFNDLAFGTILNKENIPNKELRTLELARAYIHDSVHASTYRTFMVDENDNESVYRHQYGINFRNANGISYSSPNLNDESPVSVNLNTLMDAIDQISVSEFLNEKYSDLIDQNNLNSKEQEILSEIIHMSFDEAKFPEAKKFYETVIKPASGFIDRWGEDFLKEETLKAMFSGNIDILKDYFKQTLMKDNAWEKLFRQNAYTDVIQQKNLKNSNSNSPKNKFGHNK